MKRLVLPTSILVLGGVIGWYGYPSLATERMVTPNRTLLSDTREEPSLLDSTEAATLTARPTHWGRLVFRAPTRWHALPDPAPNEDYREQSGLPTLRYRVYFRAFPTATAEAADSGELNGELKLWDPAVWLLADSEEEMMGSGLTKTQKQQNLTLLRAIYEQRSLTGAEEQLTDGAACVFYPYCPTPTITAPLAGGDFRYVESADGRWRGYRWAVAREGSGDYIYPVAHAVLLNLDLPRPLLIELFFPLHFSERDAINQSLSDENAAAAALERFSRRAPLAIRLELSRIDRFLRTLQLKTEAAE